MLGLIFTLPRTPFGTLRHFNDDGPKWPGSTPYNFETVLLIRWTMLSALNQISEFAFKEVSPGYPSRENFSFELKRLETEGLPEKISFDDFDTSWRMPVMWSVVSRAMSYLTRNERLSTLFEKRVATTWLIRSNSLNRKWDFRTYKSWLRENG